MKSIVDSNKTDRKVERMLEGEKGDKLRAEIALHNIINEMKHDIQVLSDWISSTSERDTGCWPREPTAAQMEALEPRIFSATMLNK